MHLFRESRQSSTAAGFERKATNAETAQDTHHSSPTRQIEHNNTFRSFYRDIGPLELHAFDNPAIELHDRLEHG
jgi:hypothetical protein